MTRSELVEALAERRGVSREQAEAVVDVFFGQLQQALQSGGRVELRGFGSFRVKQYGAYQARNPQTGEPVAVAPKRLPAFKPAKHLREALAAQVGEGILPADDGDGDGEE